MFWDGSRWTSDHPSPAERSPASWSNWIATAAMVMVAAAAFIPWATGRAGGPRISTSPSVAAIGDRITVSGDSFESRMKIQVAIDGQTAGLPTVTTSKTGAFATSITVPKLSIGSHVIGAFDGSRGKTRAKVASPALATATLDVQASPSAPTPAPTATPTPKPTVAPTQTPSPTRAPTAAPTSTATATPVATPTPRPSTTPTPAPTATATPPIPTVAPTSTPPPVPTLVVRTLAAGATPSQFNALASNMGIDVIEFTAGTYRNWRDARVGIDRQSRPLTVQFDPGVVFDDSGDSSYASPGFTVWDSTHDPSGTLGTWPAGYVTFTGPARFTHYLLGQVGVFLLIGAQHVTFDGLQFSNNGAAGSGGQQSSHLFYVSRGSHDIVLQNITASHLLQPDTPGAIAGINAFHFYTGGVGPSVYNVTVRNSSVSDCGWAIILRNSMRNVQVDGLTATDCGHGVPASVDFGSGNTGISSDSRTISTAGTSHIMGSMTDGGGNSWN
jgi:hypothetical protein